MHLPGDSRPSGNVDEASNLPIGHLPVAENPSVTSLLHTTRRFTRAPLHPDLADLALIKLTNMAMSRALVVALCTLALVCSASGAQLQNRRSLLTEPARTLLQSCSTANFCQGKANGNYVNPCSSSSFIQCSNGVTYVTQCPSGLVWDTSCSCCNYPKSGAGPSSPPASPTQPKASPSPSNPSPSAKAPPPPATPTTSSSEYWY